MAQIAVWFLDEDDDIRVGELVNPNRVAPDGRGIEVEFYGDNMIDVCCLRSNGEEHFFRTHVSRVSAMRAVA